MSADPAVSRFIQVSDDELDCILQEAILEMTKFATKYDVLTLIGKINKYSIKITKQALSKNRLLFNTIRCKQQMHKTTN